MWLTIVVVNLEAHDIVVVARHPKVVTDLSEYLAQFKIRNRARMCTLRDLLYEGLMRIPRGFNLFHRAVTLFECLHDLGISNYDIQIRDQPLIALLHAFLVNILHVSVPSLGSHKGAVVEEIGGLEAAFRDMLAQFKAGDSNGATVESEGT